jgi:hypothetical protein
MYKYMFRVVFELLQDKFDLRLHWSYYHTICPPGDIPFWGFLCDMDTKQKSGIGFKYIKHILNIFLICYKVLVDIFSIVPLRLTLPSLNGIGKHMFSIL